MLKHLRQTLFLRLQQQLLSVVHLELAILYQQVLLILMFRLNAIQILRGLI